MSTFTDVREQIGSRLQSYNMEVFKEPRGIIRILQGVFALINLVGLRSYDGYIDIEYGVCKPNIGHVKLPIEYPFNLESVSAEVSCFNSTTPPIVVSLEGDFSSEAEFLTTACWISIIFAIVVSFVYVKYREAYESNGNLALADFIASVLLAVLWISSVGAWGYGQSQLKNLTNPSYLKTNSHYCISNYQTDIKCLSVVRGSVTGITVSVILSFLNFFLWAASLWFLYKETPWYLQFQRA